MVLTKLMKHARTRKTEENLFQIKKEALFVLANATPQSIIKFQYTLLIWAKKEIKSYPKRSVF